MAEYGEWHSLGGLILCSSLDKMSTLDALSSLRISSFRIKRIPDGQVIVGGFGDVEQARLRTLFGPEPVVALKRLRPAGDRGQRIRVIAVGAISPGRGKMLIPIAFTVPGSRTRRVEQVKAPEYPNARRILL